MPNRVVSLTRAEHVGDIPFVANSEQTLPTRGGNLPREMFIHSLLLEIEGRLVVAVANSDAEHADSPYSLIDEIRIEGFHKQRKKNEVFFRLRGPEIRELALLYGSRAPATTGALLVATATKDFRFFLPITFPPEKMPLQQQVNYLLDAPNYESLILTVKWGDQGSVYDVGGASTYTFTAFGVGTGSPRCRVMSRYALFGSKDAVRNFFPARVWRYFKENISADLTGSGTDVRLYDLNVGEVIRSILVKTGAKATAAMGLTAGNNAFTTLSNAILANLKVLYGTNNQIRHWVDYNIFREESAELYSITPDNGYGLIDFAPNGSIGESLPTQRLSAEEIEAFFKADVTGAATQAALFAVQEIRGVPIG